MKSTAVLIKTMIIILVCISCDLLGQADTCYILPEQFVMVNSCDLLANETGNIQVKPPCMNTIFSSYEDLVLGNQIDTCTKILRTWVILDWSSSSFIKYLQIIRITPNYNHICKRNLVMPFIETDTLVIKGRDLVLNNVSSESYSFSRQLDDSLMVIDATSFLTQLNIFRMSDSTHCVASISYLPIDNTKTMYHDTIEVVASDIIPSYFYKSIFLNVGSVIQDIEGYTKVKNKFGNYVDTLTVLPSDIGSTIPVEIKYNNILKVEDTVFVKVRSCMDDKGSWINYNPRVDLEGAFEKDVTADIFIKDVVNGLCSAEYDSMLIELNNGLFQSIVTVSKVQLSKYIPAKIQLWYNNVAFTYKDLYLIVDDSTKPITKSFFAYDTPLVKNVESIVTLHSEDLLGAVSLQFGFNKLDCDITDIGYAKLDKYSLDYSLNGAATRFVWLNLYAPLNMLTESDTLLTFTILPNKDGKLSDFISIENDYSNFGYTDKEVNLDLDFNFKSYKTNQVSEPLFLLSISPNPTTNNTIDIKSSVPIDHLSLYSVDGSLLHNKIEDLGNNIYRVKWEEVSHQQMLIMSIQSGKHYASYKVLSF